MITLLHTLRARNAYKDDLIILHSLLYQYCVIVHSFLQVITNSCETVTQFCPSYHSITCSKIYYEFNYFNTKTCNSLSSTTKTEINQKIVM